METAMDGNRVIEIFSGMKLARGNMPNLWNEVIRFCFPQEPGTYGEAGNNERQTGKRRTNPVCSYPVIYSQRLGSSLHNSAFPNNNYWFSFGFCGVDLNENFALKQWCRKARDIVHNKIRQGTNFYQESHAMMLGLATLGTAGFHTYYKRGRLFFRYIPIHKNFYIESNSDGEIDMACILHEWTAKEAIEEYGYDAVSDEVRNAMRSEYGKTRTFNYIQLVYPKISFGEKCDVFKGDKPYGDITVEENTRNVVKVGGHIHFPFAVPRFLLASDDVYGRSPAMNCMGAIRSVNALRKRVLDAALRALAPAVFINSLINKPISIEAGAINRIPNFDPNSIWTYPSPSNFPVGKDQMQELLEELKHGFFIDVFQAIDQQQYMTATEITERVRQKIEGIAPIVSRLQKEFSQQVVTQALNLLIEHGEVEPPPLEAEGLAFEISYISSIDAMMNQGVASSTMQFMLQAGQIAQAYQANPDLNNIINTEAVLKRLADCAMLPASYFRTPEEAQAMRENAARNAAELQQAQSESAESQAALNYARAEAISRGNMNGVQN